MTALADDLDRTLEAALASLGTVLDLDWQVPAAGLTWSCRGTLVHVADDLFSYAGQLATRTPQLDGLVPFRYSADRDDEDETAVHADPAAGNAGVLQVVDACGGLLSAVVRTRGPEARGFHVFGVSDPDGFAAMGTVEVLLHVYDVAGGLGFAWDPDADAVRRVLARLFPDAPAGGDPWATLLAATGRAGGVPDGWRWDGSVRG
jgi:hypothetical protein